MRSVQTPTGGPVSLSRRGGLPFRSPGPAVWTRSSAGPLISRRGGCIRDRCSSLPIGVFHNVALEKRVRSGRLGGLGSFSGTCVARRQRAGLPADAATPGGDVTCAAVRLCRPAVATGRHMLPEDITAIPGGLAATRRVGAASGPAGSAEAGGRRSEEAADRHRGLSRVVAAASRRSRRWRMSKGRRPDPLGPDGPSTPGAVE